MILLSILLGLLLAWVQFQLYRTRIALTRKLLEHGARCTARGLVALSGNVIPRSAAHVILNDLERHGFAQSVVDNDDPQQRRIYALIPDESRKSV